MNRTVRDGKAHGTERVVRMHLMQSWHLRVCQRALDGRRQQEGNPQAFLHWTANPRASAGREVVTGESPWKVRGAFREIRWATTPNHHRRTHPHCMQACVRCLLNV